MKVAKNLCNITINNAKKTYWNSFCLTEISSNQDSKKMWQKIKDMKNSERLPSYPIEIANNPFPSDKDKAELFVDTFSKTSRPEGLSPTCRAFREKEEKCFLNAKPEPPKDIYINAPITLIEVQRAISAIKSKTSSVGLDIVSNAMLAHLPINGITFLCTVFQKVWNSGSIPQLWKDSIIIPIHKTGKSRKDKNNYRPIALTSHICKLFEAVILRRLSQFCEKKQHNTR